MNYLAHSFLTYSDEQIVGQFLEDFIRNKDRFSFPEKIRQGIVLHRAIDTFTDSHPAISEAKKVFAPVVRLYSGAFVDVAMDYFLANDATIKTPDEWKSFSQQVYAVLHQNVHYFPENFSRMLFHMDQDDWLYNYRYDWGIEFSMKNVLRKAKYLNEVLPVFETFLAHKIELQKCYDVFFPQLQRHIKTLAHQF